MMNMEKEPAAIIDRRKVWENHGFDETRKKYLFCIKNNPLGKSGGWKTESSLAYL